MMISILFACLCFALVASVCFSIFAKNNVHGVLWLVVAFFCTAWMYVFLTASFLAMVLIIVYVGAIATLFLFVVMMVDQNRKHKRSLLFVLSLTALLIFTVAAFYKPASLAAFNSNISFANNFVIQKSDSVLIGESLYTQYATIFEICGLILLIAMTGAVHIVSSSGCLDKQDFVRKQSIMSQVLRKKSQCIEIIKNPKSNQGLDI